MKSTTFLMIFFILLALNAQIIFAADIEVGSGSIVKAGIALHIVQIASAVFIGYMALRFLKITRPVRLFLWVYFAIGFFIINSLLHLLYFILLNTSRKVFFSSVYLASNITLSAMIISLVLFFYEWNHAMRRKIE